MTTRRAFLATLAAGFLGPSRVAEAQRTSGKVPVLPRSPRQSAKALKGDEQNGFMGECLKADKKM